MCQSLLLCALLPLNGASCMLCESCQQKTSWGIVFLSYVHFLWSYIWVIWSIFFFFDNWYDRFQGEKNLHLILFQSLKKKKPLQKYIKYYRKPLVIRQQDLFFYGINASRNGNYLWIMTGILTTVNMYNTAKCSESSCGYPCRL